MYKVGIRTSLSTKLKAKSMAQLYFLIFEVANYFYLSIDVVRCREFISRAPGQVYLLIAMQCIVRVSVNYFKLTYGCVVANLDIEIRRK